MVQRAFLTAVCGCGDALFWLPRTGVCEASVKRFDIWGSVW